MASGNNKIGNSMSSRSIGGGAAAHSALRDLAAMV